MELKKPQLRPVRMQTTTKKKGYRNLFGYKNCKNPSSVKGSIVLSCECIKENELHAGKEEETEMEVREFTCERKCQVRKQALLNSNIPSASSQDGGELAICKQGPPEESEL